MDPHSFEVTEAIYGYGFDLEAAQSIVDSAAFGQTLEIPFEKIQPEVLSESLSSVLFRDVLGTYTASSASDTNRDTNLALACKAIDGIVLYPGEKFSYNNALGERTEANGYKPGASYSGNETVYTIGGVIGKVVALDDEKLTIETSEDRVRLEFAKWAIQNVEAVADKTESTSEDNSPAKKYRLGKKKAEEPVAAPEEPVAEAAAEETSEEK